MKNDLPATYSSFLERFPAVADAHRALGAACAEGPLDARTRHLVQLGVAIGLVAEGAVKSHARQAIQAGASPAEVRHAVLLSTTTAGFTHMVAAMRWVDDAIG